MEAWMKHLYLNAAIAAMMISSCDDQLPTGAAERSRSYDTVLTSNGFVLEGGDYSARVFGLSDVSGQAFYIAAADRTIILLTDYISHPGDHNYSTIVYLTIPGAMRGNFSWENIVQSSTAITRAVISINGRDYVSVEGNTHVSFYRDVNTNRVTGSFTGRLQDAFGRTITVTDGRFDAEYDQ